MNKKTLFDIKTIVTAIIQDGEITSVRIVATKATRSAIWDLVTNGALNPGIARYEGGAPTVITLKPYPGYDGILVANLAYTLALLANVSNWADLFTSNATQLAGELVGFENFQPDQAAIDEIQQIYLNWKSITTLKNMLDNLGYSGYNIAAILEWNREATECFRRSGSLDQAKIHPMIKDLDEYAIEARRISATKAARLSALEAKIEMFETLISCASNSDVCRSYFEIWAAIEAEGDRLRGEAELHGGEFAMIRDNLMVTIRRASPPAPKK